VLLMAASPAAPALVSQQQHLLFVDTDSVTRRCAQADIDGFQIIVTATIEGARRILNHITVAGLVTDALLQDGSGIELCRAAKASTRTTSVLVIMADPQRAPDAIDAGCDGVLLKPFSPNLLFARLGRLLRTTPRPQISTRTHPWFRQAEAATADTRRTTNEQWSTDVCPYCQHVGVTAFEFSDHRRAWYACLACRKVWMAARHD
jgi:two-component system OmpR family response regulator